VAPAGDLRHGGELDTGWIATASIGVDIERGYHVFGSAGAVLVTVLTGLVLRRVLAAASDARTAPSLARA
jgi:hypothetical protein